MPLWYINTTSLDNNSTHGVPVHSEAAIPPGLKIVKKFDDLAAHGVVRTKKRLNPRQRKKMKRKSKNTSMSTPLLAETLIGLRPRRASNAWSASF